MAVPNTFANATTSIPLSQLDQNFATAITLGNTAIQLGNTVTTLNNMTLANVTVSTGNVSFTQGTIGGNVVINTTGTANTGNLSVTGITNTSTAFSVGTSVSTTGELRLKVGQSIAYRNVGNTADLNLVSIGTGNTLTFGDNNSGHIYHNVSTGQSHYTQVNSANVTTVSSTGLAVTGVTSSTYSFESTGAVQANAANKATLSLESASTGRLCVFGADTSTFGTLNLAVAKSNGGPTTVGSITSTGLAVTGIINTGTATTSGASANDICLPNNIALRGANTTNAASRTLAYVDTGNFAAYGDASLNGVKITGNTAVTGTGGGSYVGQFTNSNSTSYGLYVAAGGGGSRQIAYFADYAGAMTMNVQSGSVSVTGALSCTGALSKGSGSFRITHPLPQLSETHQLVHSFIEGPKADLIYRGKVNLVNGAASVNIDEAAGMTEGTFVVLCRDVQCFTTNESDWTPVRGSVSGNVLTIEAQDNTSTASVSWMVIGERQDRHMYETDWTDDNGRVIVEPLTPVTVEVTQ